MAVTIAYFLELLNSFFFFYIEISFYRQEVVHWRTVGPPGGLPVHSQHRQVLRLPSARGPTEASDRHHRPQHRGAETVSDEADPS